MISDIVLTIKLLIGFLPFLLFAYLNTKANVKQQVRNRQYMMLPVAIAYSVTLYVLYDKVVGWCLQLLLKVVDILEVFHLGAVAEIVLSLYNRQGIFLILILFNTMTLIVYVIFKKILLLFVEKIAVKKDTFIGKLTGVFYAYDEKDEQWYIKEHYGQARIFIRNIYYGCCGASMAALLVSFGLCQNQKITEPFYPVFVILIIGELAFYIDGLGKEEKTSDIIVKADRSKHVAMYPLLRKPLKDLFSDKIAADGTTVNNGAATGGSVEDILVNIEKSGGHVGKNYAAFIRRKMKDGLKPNVDYVRSGYDLATGKSLLFNTPFYNKLDPYAFYAMNRTMLTGGKVLIISGRHGTEKDLYQWCESGIKQVSNVPDLWKIALLSDKKEKEQEIPDVGIISRSGVYDLDTHKINASFLKQVAFIVVVEPSRLVTTAQIGLKLLVKCCGTGKNITFCSVDQNCDGLVDALSHILMTNITEVSATEYPHGISSYMYWKADDEYLQHRILPGVSRCLGIGMEISAVALRNQVKKTVWYGGESFPVLDVHWIAKQYYHELLSYARLPENQETFDHYFQTSFNMCNGKVQDYSFFTVEDERNNLFETRRNFATMAEQQGFVNVISSEYMLREYMTENPELFTADAKAIPYIAADYALTKRNAILSLCLRLYVGSVSEEALQRQMLLLGIDEENPIPEIWKEICIIFGEGEGKETDRNGNRILSVRGKDKRMVSFEMDKTILFKREYSVETGTFESVYKIENKDFAGIILDDLQNASYIAERENEDVYIGTELKGHIYQKYMPGQLFTLNGKYYEMVSATADNRILVRRASEHIGGRVFYRQVRNYTFYSLQNSDAMGELKTINGINIHYQFADFSVETDGYWKMSAYNDFMNGDLVTINGMPIREYHHKQVLKLDFSNYGDRFTDEVRKTLTHLLNETFVTLFAENQPFVSAITPGTYTAPLTYGLTMEEEIGEALDKCIFIVEDSQLDIGLLIAVERNINRILQIVADYLNWNSEQIEKSLEEGTERKEEKRLTEFDVYTPKEKPEKKGFFSKIKEWFQKLFKKKSKDPEKAEVTADE